MFGLFTPKCPLDTAHKAWVESKMLWFAERFGAERARAATVIMPTPEFFPDPYSADETGARRCLDRVCGYMGVAPESISLSVLPDEHMPGAAGWYLMREKSVVCIARSQLADPERLIATLAHEVAHDILLRGGHLTGDEPDHEQVTDLLPAFLGIGMFAANSTLRESAWNDGSYSYWSWSSQGYLTSAVHGYALAVFAFVRDEAWPEWRKRLRPDTRGAFEKGLRFLQKTGDSLCTPGTAGTRRPPPTAATALDGLTSRSATVRVAALWDVVATPLADAALLAPVIECLSHPDGAVRAEAAWAVPVFGPAAVVAAPRLLALLTGDPGAQAAAARALGALRADPKMVVPELVRALHNQYGYPSDEVINALRAYGPDAAEAVPNLLSAFELAVANNDDLTPALAAAVLATCPNAPQALREHVGDRDPELLRLALSELKSIQVSPEAPRRPPTAAVVIPLPRAPR